MRLFLLWQQDFQKPKINLYKITIYGVKMRLFNLTEEYIVGKNFKGKKS